jgi:Xaa-Pro aminopeptidase
MFEKHIYQGRRDELVKTLDSGLLLFLGNEESPMNYPGNPFRFRQDSTFLYYWGLDSPGLAAVIDMDANKEIIFGYDFSVDDVVWMGPQPTLRERTERIGVKQFHPIDKLGETIDKAKKKSRKIHYLPQYRASNILQLENLLDLPSAEINHRVSSELIQSVVSQRSVKAPEEIREIEAALDIAYEMQMYAMENTKPGIYEREIAGGMEGIASSLGNGISFPIIFSIHGETLHNHFHGNRMEQGQMAVNDSGAESLHHYASDITRTIPVSGRFSPAQRDIYQIVLDAQMGAIEAMKPGIKFKEVHLIAAKIIAEGMKNLGFLKGNMDEAVAAGAHALYFPHGLGHMLGLDVHDMENLGEDYVGYDENTRRSEQFGLAYLRMAKELQTGYVLTVEPGIYFIPELIRLWKNEKKFSQYIDYKKTESYIGFGGIRIEDDVLVTGDGRKILGKPIPKRIEDIEAIH